LNQHFAIVERPMFQAADNLNSKKHKWLSQVLMPALIHAARSTERRAAIEAIAAQRHIDWTGQPRQLSVRTIERWIAAHDLLGAAAFVPQARRDKNVTRVAISKTWDGAIDLDPVTRSQIAAELQRYIRGLIIKDTQRAVIKTLAASKLRELTIAACPSATALPDAVFAIPRRFIDQEHRYRQVAIFDKNRKASEDSKPRVLRTRAGLQPQQIIVGDVHHLDIVMRRADGSEAWPKAIGWLDLATNRIWLDVVLLEKGQGVRNADVIASFINMATAWGMPEALYLDNGSEYRWADFVNDALKLVANIKCYDDERSSQIIRAKPYNAAAKAIEGIFGLLEQRYFRTLPGWAGGDRTNKRTHKVGRPTEPFLGTIADLRTAIGSYVSLYHITPQLGSLKGKSPQQAIDDAIEAGWQRIAIDSRELHAVFASDETRIPRQGYISFAGDKWTCRELQAFQGNQVIVRIPKFDNAAVLPLLDPVNRRVIGYATRAVRYGMLDPAGARAAADMDRASRDGVRQLRASAAKVDPNDETARLVKTLPAAPVAPIAGRIGISNETSEIARGIAEKPVDRRNRLQDEQERSHRARLAIINRALKKDGA
jgi:hypothetical protein